MPDQLSHIANDQCPKCNEYILSGWTCQYCDKTKSKPIDPELMKQIAADFQKQLDFKKARGVKK